MAKGLIALTCNAVAMICYDDIYKWILVTRDLNPGTSPLLFQQHPLMSCSLIASDHCRCSSLPDHPCWGCGKTGHLRWDCPNTSPKTCCPKCNKSFHWAKLFCSQSTDSHGPLNPRQGNSKPHHRVFWKLSVFPHSPMITIHIDRLPVKELVDTGQDINIITETKALIFSRLEVQTRLLCQQTGRTKEHLCYCLSGTLEGPR